MFGLNILLALEGKMDADHSSSGQFLARGFFVEPGDDAGLGWQSASASLVPCVRPDRICFVLRPEPSSQSAMGVSVARQTLPLTLQSGSAVTARTVGIDDAIVAGWTGRDAAALEKHIAELEAVGVKRPATTPIFYRVSAARLTTASEIEAVGAHSGGEVEFVVLQHGGRMWVGAGSDHTDREVETYGVTVSKQVCDKPVAPVFWAFDDVAPHWDRLILRAHVIENGERKIYQEGPVAAMLKPLDLIERCPLAAGTAGVPSALFQPTASPVLSAEAGGTGHPKSHGDLGTPTPAVPGRVRLPENTLMFCGTLATRGGVRPTERFEFEIEDPVLGRSIAHGYSVRILPVLG
jgi:Protein of unknown function (DUF2848)